MSTRMEPYPGRAYALVVASPMVASWNQMAGWLRAVDGLRCAA